ncbi:GNAT family N-acetyltransferase [Streptomyces sp. NPDC046261]|uniref:GNAT family N-acetyltransferase n=1 Tax=Streptomyces sp. NPDC046261 TaxID=3157200 RepID=UPI0033F47718
MTAPNGPTVDILTGVDAIPAETWDELAPPHDPMWGREVFAAMERGAIGPDSYAYAVVRDAGRTLAILPLSAVRGLRLEQVVGPRERRMLAPISRLFPSLLRVPMLFCGNFLGQGHVLSREPLPPPVAELLVRTVLDYARRNRLGTVVFKDFAPDELTALGPALRAAHFFQVPSMPDTELPLGHATFDDYLAALPAKPRRNARNKLRKFQARDDLRIEVLTDFADLIPDMLRLYRQVMDRADQTLDVLDESFLQALQQAGGPDQRLVACFEGDRLVAFLHCLFRGEGAIGARIGLDYRLAHEARLYHNVHYAAIELAIDRKCRHIRFAQTAYEPKRELGCELVDQYYAMTHVSPLPRAVLRLLLPRALNTALARTLAPRS